MDLAYRHSVYLDHPEWIVLSSVLSLSYGNAADIRRCMDNNLASRTEKQPLEYPSAGSVFKRPVDNFAGRMVETVGLKGYSIGGAQVSEKHAGFIVNRGGATAADVIALVRLVRDAVEEVYRYRLECEIRLITDGLGPDGDITW
jgi:UDP-N-acetylmuramate dehydrogenase